MKAGIALSGARQQAGLSQAALAAATGTSQATISAYESGAKEPSLRTLTRLLSAAGCRLTVTPIEGPRLVEPTLRQLSEVAQRLVDVIALAEALPVRHEASLRYPKLAQHW